MPSKFIIKCYKENGVYHVYNRGSNKEKVFSDNQDYAVFMSYLKTYLVPPSKQQKPLKPYAYIKKNYSKQIELLSFCLMPNHFHLLIRQKHEKDLSEFMRSLITNYAMYFNRRNKRVGPLFQGNYKAILITDDNYLLHLSRYIHLNPLNKKLKRLDLLKKLSEYDFSSYQEYLGLRETEWIKQDPILEILKGGEGKSTKYKDYENFMNEVDVDSVLYLGDSCLD